MTLKKYNSLPILGNLKMLVITPILENESKFNT